MSTEAEIILVADRKASPKSTPPTPKFEYQPSAGDYRQTQAQAAAAFAESNNFQFQDLKLPDGKALLSALKELSKQMGDQPTSFGRLSDGSMLEATKANGHLTSAALVGADGSTDLAKFDDKLHVRSEVLTTAFGLREREYRANNTIATETNIVAAADGKSKPAYADRLEFDNKGNVIHSHSETAADIKDDKRLPDGSGLAVVDHKDADPKRAFIDTARTNKDGSAIEDKKFADGNFAHLEINSKGFVTRLDESDISKNLVHRQLRTPNGEVKEFTDRLI